MKRGGKNCNQHLIKTTDRISDTEVTTYIQGLYICDSESYESMVAKGQYRPSVKAVSQCAGD